MDQPRQGRRIFFRETRRRQTFQSSDQDDIENLGKKAYTVSRGRDDTASTYEIQSVHSIEGAFRKGVHMPHCRIAQRQKGQKNTTLRLARAHETTKSKKI